MRCAQVDYQPSDTSAQQSPDRHARHPCPKHINNEPAPPAPAHVMGTEQSQPEHHEWKCSAVIPAGFSREAEAQWVGVERMLHLHIAREDRIRRRENRAEQHSSPQREVEQPYADSGDQGHRECHCTESEP